MSCWGWAGSRRWGTACLRTGCSRRSPASTRHSRASAWWEEIVSQAAWLIPELSARHRTQPQFRVDTTSAVPAAGLMSSLFQEHASAYHIVQLIAKYVGVEKELWRRPFYLKAQ